MNANKNKRNLNLLMEQNSDILILSFSLLRGDNNKIGVKSDTLSHQMTGHLPPPPTKASVRSNRQWNNQYVNNDNLSNLHIINTPQNHINSVNNVNNNNNNNHINSNQSMSFIHFIEFSFKDNF